MPSYGLRTRNFLRSFHRPQPTQLHHKYYHSTIYRSKMSSSSVSPSEATQEPKPQMPPGQDEADITTKLKQLTALQSDTKATKWTLVLDGAGIQRSFKFKGFNKAWVYNIEFSSTAHGKRSADVSCRRSWMQWQRNAKSATTTLNGRMCVFPRSYLTISL